MRIRTIKPEFWESESLGRVSVGARLLFVGLFSCCDDSGRTRASSRLLASRLFPYENRAEKQIEGWLEELAQETCIRRYVVDGEHYLDIPKWLSHQKIDKPSPSKLPPFVEDSRGFAKNSSGMGTGNGNGNREGEQGVEGGSDTPPAPPSSDPDSGKKTDEEWLADIAKDPAYEGINVAIEWAKMRRWCAEHVKAPTRRRFINWLNRADRPMGADAAKPYLIAGQLPL